MRMGSHPSSMAIWASRSLAKSSLVRRSTQARRRGCRAALLSASSACETGRSRPDAVARGTVAPRPAPREPGPGEGRESGGGIGLAVAEGHGLAGTEGHGAHTAPRRAVGCRSPTGARSSAVTAAVGVEGTSTPAAPAPVPPLAARPAEAAVIPAAPPVAVGCGGAGTAGGAAPVSAGTHGSSVASRTVPGSPFAAATQAQTVCPRMHASSLWRKSVREVVRASSSPSVCFSVAEAGLHGPAPLVERLDLCKGRAEGGEAVEVVIVVPERVQPGVHAAGEGALGGRGGESVDPLLHVGARVSAHAQQQMDTVRVGDAHEVVRVVAAVGHHDGAGRQEGGREEANGVGALVAVLVEAVVDDAACGDVGETG